MPLGPLWWVAGSSWRAAGRFLYLGVWGIPLLVSHGDVDARFYISKCTQTPSLYPVQTPCEAS